MDALDFMVDRDQHMRPLEYDLSENFNALLRYMQDMGILDNVPVGTTSESEIVSISDAYPAPPRALTVYGKSTQAGTPTPDAPVPILSVDDLSLVMAPTLLLEQGAIVNGAESVNANRVRAVSTIDVVASSRISCVGICAAGTFNWGAAYYNASGTYLSATSTWLASGASVTVPSNATAARLYFRTAENTSVVPSDFTVVVPSIGTTVPNLLPDGYSLRSLPDGTKDTLSLSYLRPSTRAGWAWYSREVVQAVGHVADMGELTWTLNATNGYFTARIDDMNQTTSTRLEGLLCTAYGMSATSSLTPTSPEDKKMMRYGGMIVIRDSSYSAAADFKAALDASLDYQLATPVTTQLDPIELPIIPAPNATVWCDGGNEQPTLTLEYVRDANAALADLSEAIADIVSG